MISQVTEEYRKLKVLASADLKGQAVAEHLAKVAKITVGFLTDNCNWAPLTSKVAGKEYVAFSLIPGGKVSRSINSALYSPEALSNLAYFADGRLADLPAGGRAQLLYTVAAGFFAVIDLLKTGDQKTPATYFEILVGHLLSRAFDTNPRTLVGVLHLEAEKGTLPTDFIFDLGRRRPKFHVPVKTSTRERAIQVFAHQRVLEGVLGFGTFTGLLVCFAETKQDLKKREVIEICLPKQWVLYQKHIAPLTRFYYFDVPD